MNLLDFKKLIASIPEEHDHKPVLLMRVQYVVDNPDAMEKEKSAMEGMIDIVAHPDPDGVVDVNQTRVELAGQPSDDEPDIKHIGSHVVQVKVD